MRSQLHENQSHQSQHYSQHDTENWYGGSWGIAEAAMHTASLIATGFSIVTTLSRTRIIAQKLVENYGMSRFCKNI